MSEYNIQMNKYNALNAGYDQLYPATKIENVDGLNTALQKKVNQNLLDNPWFTVNQRGVSSYTTIGSYGVDRWKCGYADTISINSNNEITLNGTLGYSATLEQPMERSLLNLIDKQVTFSFLTTSGDVKSASFTVRDSFENYYGVDNENKEHVCIDTRKNLQTCYVEISGKSVTIKAIKLELGTVSTLANDVPPNYQQELAKCQRYFVRYLDNASISANIGSGIAYDDKIFTCVLPLSVPMRAIPTFSMYDANVSNERSLFTISNVAVKNMVANTVNLEITTSGLTVGYPYYIKLGGGGAYIDLSADL